MDIIGTFGERIMKKYFLINRYVSWNILMKKIFKSFVKTKICLII